MDEHKKKYSTEDFALGGTAHIYSDGVHTGSGSTQELADDAYQKAKTDDLDHVHYVIEPKEWDSFYWNSDGKKVDRD